MTDITPQGLAARGVRMKARLELDISLLRELLSYNAETGFLFWKERAPKHFQESARRTAAAVHVKRLEIHGQFARAS